MLDTIIQKLIDFGLSAGIRLIGSFFLLIIGLKLIKLFLSSMNKGEKFSNIDGSAKSFFKSFLSITLKTILIVTVATILGVPTTSMIAVLGSIGLAIGLSLQGSLSNFAGGVIIIVFKPFRIGDYITVGDSGGTVESIDIFYTKLRTIDNKSITIPNGSITNNAITDYTEYSTRRVDFTFTTSYNSDITKVKEILLLIAENHPLILKDPAPMARLSEHGDSALIFVFRVWCNTEDYWAIYFDINETVKTEFTNNGIEIPFPQLDVHISK